MVNKLLLPSLALVMLLFACSNSGNSKENESGEMTQKKETTETPIKKQAPALKPHTDNGQPYFAYLLIKGDSIICDIQSDKPLVFWGNTNTVIQLDSSHHLMVNASTVNIYLNAKNKGVYPVVLMNAGKDTATIIATFDKKDGTKNNFTPDKGMVTIHKMENNTCSGFFEASLNKNNEVFLLKGEFKNAKIN